MKATMIVPSLLFLTAATFASAAQIVMRVPADAMLEYRAVFDSAPLFADLSHISPQNIAGFNPYAVPLSTGGRLLGNVHGGMRI